MIGYAIRLAAVAALVSAISASAQIPTDVPIGAVEIRGLERVSEQLVRSQLEVQPEQLYNPLAIARDIRRLFNLGRFADVQAEGDVVGGDLVITYIVEEQRFIDDVKIIGNRKIKDRALRAVIGWQEGDSFYEDGYESERDAVLKLYRSKGFLNTSVDILVEEISASRVRVTYSIDEGRKARIRSITINGNKVLSDRELRKLMKTKRARWFLGGRYDENIFEFDLQEVILEYRNYGRMEADIVETEFVQRKGGKRLDIVINLREGPEYTVENFEVADNIVFEDDELLNSVKVVSGDVHNQGQIEEDAEAIQTGYRDFGYVDALARTQITLDRDKKTTNVVHRILEGDMKYIREIKITGNDVTRDDVIRRSLLLAPGDRFDGAALRASQNQLEATQYFESAPRVTRETIPGDDRFENLLVDVEEGRTGNFNFGAGFSSAERLGGFVEFRLRNFDITNWPNFSGAGQQLVASFNIGDVRTEYNLSFTDPEFLDYPFSFGVDIYNQSLRTRGGSSFREETQGAQIRLGKSLSPYVSGRTALRYTSVDIDGLTRGLLTPFLRREVRELNDPGTTIANNWGITRNTLNHFRDPSAGSLHRLDLELAGLGGDNDFVKLQHDSTWYWSLDDKAKWVLSYRTREGISSPYGDKKLVPLSDRFFAGGASTVRGYDSRDIGPKIRTFLFFGDEQSIGGELRILNSLEVRYKVGDILRLYGFIDSGGVWKTASDFDFGGFRFSAGIGIGVEIPGFGPMRVDYGFPLNPDDDQGSGRLHLTTGIRF